MTPEQIADEVSTLLVERITDGEHGSRLYLALYTWQKEHKRVLTGAEYAQVCQLIDW